jgi:hypothetical protein
MFDIFWSADHLLMFLADWMYCSYPREDRNSSLFWILPSTVSFWRVLELYFGAGCSNFMDIAIPFPDDIK